MAVRPRWINLSNPSLFVTSTIWRSAVTLKASEPFGLVPLPPPCDRMKCIRLSRARNRSAVSAWMSNFRLKSALLNRPLQRLKYTSIVRWWPRSRSGHPSPSRSATDGPPYLFFAPPAYRSPAAWLTSRKYAAASVLSSKHTLSVSCNSVEFIIFILLEFVHRRTNELDLACLIHKCEEVFEWGHRKQKVSTGDSREIVGNQWRVHPSITTHFYHFYHFIPNLLKSSIILCTAAFGLKMPN